MKFRAEVLIDVNLAHTGDWCVLPTKVTTGYIRRQLSDLLERINHPAITARLGEVTQDVDEKTS